MLHTSLHFNAKGSSAFQIYETFFLDIIPKNYEFYFSFALVCFGLKFIPTLKQFTCHMNLAVLLIFLQGNTTG